MVVLFTPTALKHLQSRREETSWLWLSVNSGVNCSFLWPQKREQAIRENKQIDEKQKVPPMFSPTKMYEDD